MTHSNHIRQLRRAGVIGRGGEAHHLVLDLAGEPRAQPVRRERLEPVAECVCSVVDRPVEHGLATMSACERVVTQSAESSQAAEPPCFFRYLSAVTPAKVWSPKPSRLTGPAFVGAPAAEAGAESAGVGC